MHNDHFQEFVRDEQVLLGQARVPTRAAFISHISYTSYTRIHTHIHMYIHPYHTSYTRIHTHIHTYIHPYHTSHTHHTHAYIHTYMCTYIRKLIRTCMCCASYLNYLKNVFSYYRMCSLTTECVLLLLPTTTF